MPQPSVTQLCALLLAVWLTRCTHLPHRCLACRGKTTAGVPQAVTCQVDVAFNDLPVAFTAQAFQGTVNAPVDTTLRSAQSQPYT